MLDVTVITAKTLSLFEPLMTPSAYALLADGRPLTAIGLVEDATACGALCGYVSDSEFVILSLFVAPDYRRRGGATLLLDTLEELLEDVPAVSVITATYNITREELDPLVDLFVEADYVHSPPDDQPLYMSTIEKLAALPIFAERGAGESSSALPFTQLPDYMVTAIDRELGGVLPEPLAKAAFDREVSVGYLDHDGLRGLIVFDHSVDGGLTLAYAYSGGRKNSSQQLRVMLSRAMALVKAKYPPETRLFVNAVSPTSESLVRRISEDGGDFAPVSRTAEKDVSGDVDFSYLGGLDL